MVTCIAHVIISLFIFVLFATLCPIPIHRTGWIEITYIFNRLECLLLHSSRWSKLCPFVSSSSISRSNNKVCIVLRSVCCLFSQVISSQQNNLRQINNRIIHLRTNCSNCLTLQHFPVNTKQSPSKNVSVKILVSHDKLKRIQFNWWDSNPFRKKSTKYWSLVSFIQKAKAKQKLISISLTEPVGFKAPTFSTESKSFTFEKHVGHSFGLLCQAQAYPVPLIR